jgi:energy-coupling factor transporter ATP-binding protein EcfA2
LEDYEKKRDEEKEITTAEKSKEAEKKETSLLARSIATGKSRLANSIEGAVELPESRRLRGVYLPMTRESLPIWIWLVMIWK